MKKIMLFAGLLLTAGLSAQAQETALATAATTPARASAVFSWEQSTHQFGTIPQGKPATVTFRFTNTGSIPLVISQVQGSCGCTATDYSREPIAPGKSGYVKATYNASATGPFHKTVTVTANTGNPVLLTIKGEVKPQ